MSDYQESIIRTDAREVGVFLDQKQIQLFLIYLRELKEWNQKVNLTSLKDDTSIIKNHFIDSLSIIPHLPSAISLLDMGAGAGFPGVPLKIARPHSKSPSSKLPEKKPTFSGISSGHWNFPILPRLKDGQRLSPLTINPIPSLILLSPGPLPD